MKFTQAAALLVFCLLSSLANAQLRPGSKLLTGSFSVNSSTTDYNSSSDEKTFYFDLTPKLGFVTKENRVWGIMANLGLGWRNGDQSNSTVGGGLFMRQYKKFGNSAFSGFLEETIGALGFKNITYSGQDPFSTSKGWLAELQLNPGLAFQLSRKSFLELTIKGISNARFVSEKVRPTDAGLNLITNSDSKSFSLSSSLQSPFYAMTIGYSFNF